MQNIYYFIVNPRNTPSAAYNRIRLFEKGLKEYNVNCSVIFLKTVYGFYRPFKIIFLLMYYFKYFLSRNNILIVYGDNYLWHLFSFPRKAVVYVERNEFPSFLIDNNVKKTQQSVDWLNQLYNVDGLITCSETLRNYYSQYLRKCARVHISNVIVDVREFQVKCATDSKISYCGDWGNHKDGVDLLIKAFAQFHQKHSNYYLELIGGSTLEVETYIHQIAVNLGVDPFIKYVGRIPHELMASHLCSAEVLALARPANKQAEGGFPSKVAEYLATGRPVVLTNVGELNLYLTDNVNCFMAQPNSVECFAEKLCEAVEHPQRFLIGYCGYKKSLEFDYTRKASQLIDFLTSD